MGREKIGHEVDRLWKTNKGEIPSEGISVRIGKRGYRIKARIDHGLSRWFEWSTRHAVWVIVLSLFAAAGALFHTIHHLKINTYPGNVLSDSLPWRQDKLAYERAFPTFRDSIVVVIDAPTPDQARDAADRLALRLSDDHEHFEWVFYPPGTAFFRQHGLLFMGLDELELRTERLAQAQPFLADIAQDPSLSGTFHLLRRALTQERPTEIDLGSLFQGLAGTLDDALMGLDRPLSWSQEMSGVRSDKDRRVLMEVMPKVEYSSLAPGEAMVAAIRGAGDALGFEADGIRLRISGAAALSIDELKSASLGAQMASFGSFAGVALVMLVGLRSLWLVFAVQVGLILGLIFTAFFATVALGQLNLISVAFSVMYIGIGADYAIYLCLRYRELSGSSRHHRAALKRAVRHVGGSLEIGTLTTAIGFFCFIPTSYRGVAELGIISGAGMFISLFITLLVLPAFLCLRRPTAYREHTGTPEGPMSRLAVYILGYPIRHSRAVLIAAALLGLLSSLELEQSRFDHNPLNLQDPSSESVQTFRELLKDGGNSPWSLAVLAANEVEAEALKAKLSGLSAVDSVVTLKDFIPEGQEDKLTLIDQLGVTLGTRLMAGSKAVPEEEPERSLTTLRGFQADLATYLYRHPTGDDASKGTRLELNLARTLDHLEGLDAAARSLYLNHLGRMLVGELRPNLDRLQDALKAGPVTIESLPSDLKSRWINGDGIWRVDVRPREDLHDPSAMRRFVDQVRSVAPHATGTPVLFLESSQAVVRAFLEAFGLAILAITAVLFFTMERRIDVVLVLAPLLLASVLTGAFMVRWGVPFNFANIIALPLIFGMGVDNCIHMVHRYRTAPPQNGVLLHTSTALAVLLSALTNISGFGNLSVAPHRGMASMGVMLTIGILATLFCSMLVLPALLREWERFQSHRGNSA